MRYCSQNILKWNDAGDFSVKFLGMQYSVIAASDCCSTYIHEGGVEWQYFLVVIHILPILMTKYCNVTNNPLAADDGVSDGHNLEEDREEQRGSNWNRRHSGQQRLPLGQMVCPSTHLQQDTAAAELLLLSRNTLQKLFHFWLNLKESNYVSISDLYISKMFIGLIFSISFLLESHKAGKNY